MGACQRWFTETALEMLVESVYTVWNCDKKSMASILSLNVAEVFDYILYSQLLHNLKSKGILEYIIQ